MRRDFEAWFTHVVPERSALWTHTFEGRRHARARQGVAAPAPLSLPVSGGGLALGTWQGIYVEHRDGGGPRSLVATLWGQSRERR